MVIQAILQVFDASNFFLPFRNDAKVLLMLILTEDRKVVNALLTFDFLAKISHLLPKYHKPAFAPHTSIQAFIRSLLRPPPAATPATLCDVGPASKSTGVASSTSATNLSSKTAGLYLPSAIIRTNSTTLPARDVGDFRDSRLRAGTLSPRVSGLSSDRSKLRGMAGFDETSSRVMSGSSSVLGERAAAASESGHLTSSFQSTMSANLEHPLVKTGTENLRSSAGGFSGLFPNSRSSSVSSNRQTSATEALSGKGWERPGPEGDQDRVQVVSFEPEVAELLQYCTQAEVLLSTFTQDLYYRLIKSVPCSTEDECDATNRVLYSLLLDQLLDLHNGHEIPLSPQDHKLLPQLLRKRHEHRGGCFAEYFVECEEEVPKWRCLVKASSSTKLLLTLLPASYHDLKLLLLHRSNLTPDCTNPALRLVSPYEDFLKLEKEASQESSDRSELLLLHRGSTESNGSSVLVSAQSMSQRSSTLSSSGQYGGRLQGGLGSSSSGMTSATLLHHHLLPHQQSLPPSPRPSSSLTFSKIPSDGIVPSVSHQHLPVRTRFKSGPSHSHHTQKSQLSSGPNKEGFSRARASSFHGRRERSGSLSQWLRGGERCRRGSVGEGSESPSPQVSHGGQMSPLCPNPHCHHSLHLRHSNMSKQQSQQQVPYHVQVAKQHSAPNAEKSRKRYVSMPMKSLPASGGGASPCPHDQHGRSMSASVSTEALHGTATSVTTEKMASNSSSGRTGEAGGCDRSGGGPEKSSSHRPLLGALTLPIYLYDCRLDIIISQLVHRSKTRNTLKDIFKDFTLHTETIPTTERVSRSGKKEDDRDESYYSEQHFMPPGDESEDRCSDAPLGAAGLKGSKEVTDVAIDANGSAAHSVGDAIETIIAAGEYASDTVGTTDTTKGSASSSTVGTHVASKITSGGESDNRRGSSRFMTAHEASRQRHTCDDTDQRAAETSSSLVWLATAVEACQYRCLVVSSFEALRAGLSLHPTDLNPVLDQCHESVHEIDITEYLHAICGHLRDFSLRLKEEEKQQLLQNHRSPATPSPAHKADLDNWEKQGTLEQMESVEQLGHSEHNLVRRTNTRDELSLAPPNSSELPDIHPRVRQCSGSVRIQAEGVPVKPFTGAEVGLHRPLDKTVSPSDVNMSFSRDETFSAELRMVSRSDPTGVEPEPISPSETSAEKCLKNFKLTPLTMMEEREIKSVQTLVRSEISKTLITTTANEQERPKKIECLEKNKSSTESGESQPRPVLERQDSFHDDQTLSFDQYPTGAKTSPAKRRPPRMSRRSTSNSTSTSSLFPVCLLEQHQPCRPLQSLHSSIRQRCAGVLSQHYAPVPSMPDHHFYMGGPANTCTASSTTGPGASQGLHGKVRSFSAKRSLKYQRSVSGGGGDEDGGSGSWTAVGDEVDSTVGEDYVDGDDVLDPSIEFRSDVSSVATRRLHSLASYHDFEEDRSSLLSEGVSSPSLMRAGGKSGGSGPLPLFLHLTCTLRCPGIEPITSPMTSLPTCLRDVIPSLLEQELDLRELRLSLDVLSLTLPPSLATPLFPHVIPSSASANLAHQQQQVQRRRRKSSSGVFYRFSMCSSSSPPPSFIHRGPLGEREACDTQQLLSDLDESIEEDPIDMLPEEQRLAISNTTQQLSWLVLDEVCAIGLQELPLTEATVSRVVQHVRRSQHCPNAAFTAVPLDFVTGGRAARDVFIQEFDQLSVYQGEYRLHKLGRHHVLVLGNRHRTRHLASLVPPLAPLTTPATAALHPHKLVPHDNNVIMQQLGVTSEKAFLSSDLQKLGEEPLYTTPSVLRTCSPMPRDSDLGSSYSKRPQPAHKETSPTKLSRRVSFHTLDAEESQDDIEPGSAAAEKLKWVKRRERKERRDSERRGSVSTSDSESDNDVHHRSPYSRECSQPREKSRDKERSKHSRDRVTAASSVRSSMSMTSAGNITATSGAFCATTGGVVTASSGASGALTVTSGAYSNAPVEAIGPSSTGAVCPSTTDASSGIESSERGDVIDGASMSRQSGTLQQSKQKRYSTLSDARHQQSKNEGSGPLHAVGHKLPHNRLVQTDAGVSYPELERGSVITCGGIQQQELLFTLEGDQVAMTTNDSIEGTRRKPLHARHIMSPQGNISHPPLRRTSGSGGKEAVEMVRKSASSDECIAAARRDAGSDTTAASSLSRRRHFSATALETSPHAVPGEWLYFPGEWLYFPGEWLYFPGDWLYFPGDWLYFPGDWPHFTGDNTAIRYKPDTGHAIATSAVAATAAGLASDVSSLLESGQTTDIGCEGDISESDDCADWLQEFETAQPCLPRFWLIMHVGERCVTVYFHCRLPSDVCHYMCVLEDTLSLVSALVHHVNQSLLLHSLHSTRLCHSLLTPPSPGTPWGDTYIVNTEDDSLLAEATDDSYREASLRHEPGTFQCPIVWSTSFPLHPRLKAGYGTKGGSKGLQALRSTLNMFSVNNRTNMFVYQDTSGPNNNDNVFYLKLSELISPNTSVYGKRGANPSHPSGSLSGSSSCATVTGGQASTCNAGAHVTSNISGTIISNVPSCSGTSSAALQHSALTELPASAPQSFSSATDSVHGVAGTSSDLARSDREDVMKTSIGIVRNSSKEEESTFPHMGDPAGAGFVSTTSSLVTPLPEALSSAASGPTTQVLPAVVGSAASTAIGDQRTRVSSFGERDVIMEGVAAAHACIPSRCPDSIELIVHGIAQPGSSIRQELVSMLQKRLDEAVLDAVCVMLWNNPLYKLPVEDVHFIQPPKQDPQLTLKLSIGPCPGQQLPSLLLYLRQNMQAAGFSKPKYADARASSHFQVSHPATLCYCPTSSYFVISQDVCAGEPNIETDDNNVFLFISKRMSGACGIACITMALEDRNSGSPVQLNNLAASAIAKENSSSWAAGTATSNAIDLENVTGAASAVPTNSDAAAAHTSSDSVSAAVLLSQHRFDVLTRASDLCISESNSESSQERVVCTYPRGDGQVPTDCVVRFRVWTIGRVAQDDMSSTLRHVCRHALWDLHTEHQLLTPHLLLCNALADLHRTSAVDDGTGTDLPTTPRGRLMSAPSAALAFQRRFSMFSSSRHAPQLPRRGSVAATTGAPGPSKLPYFGLLESRRASIPCVLLETRRVTTSSLSFCGINVPASDHHLLVEQNDRKAVVALRDSSGPTHVMSTLCVRNITKDSMNRGAVRVHPDTTDGGTAEGPIRIPRRYPSVPGGGTPSSYATTSITNDLDDETLDLDEEDEIIEDEASAVEREMLEMLSQKELDVQYARVVVPWLQFGASLHVPTVRSFHYDLPNSGSVCAFLEELQRWLSVHSDESPLTCYQRSSLADVCRQVTRNVRQRLSLHRQAYSDSGQAYQQRKGSLHGSSLKMDKPKKSEARSGSQKYEIGEDSKTEPRRESFKGPIKLDDGSRRRPSAAKNQLLSCKRFVSFATDTYEKKFRRQTKSRSQEYTYLFVPKYKPSSVEFRCESGDGEASTAQPTQECLLFARSPPNSAAAADLSYKTQLDGHRPGQLFLPSCLQLKQQQIVTSSSQSSTVTPVVTSSTCVAQVTPVRSTSPIRSRASHPCYSASPAVPSRPSMQVPLQNLHQSLPSVTMSASVDVSSGTGVLPYFRLRRDSASASTTTPSNISTHAPVVSSSAINNIANVTSGTTFDAGFSQSDTASIGRGAAGELNKCRAESSGSGTTVSTVTEATAEGSGRVMLLPRHTLLATFVQKNQVGVMLYNWSRESAERLNDHLTLMLQWTSARHALLSSIALQKLSLFHDQPFCRLPEDDSTSGRCAVNPDVRATSAFFRARSNAPTVDADQKSELARSSRASSMLGTSASAANKPVGGGKIPENRFLNNVQLLERLIKLPAPTRDVIASIKSQQKGPRYSNSALQPPLKFTSQQQQLKFMHQQRFGPQRQQQELKIKSRETTSSVSYSLSNYGEAFMWRGYPSAQLDVSVSQADPLHAHGAQFLAQAAARADRVEARLRLGEVLVCAGSTAANSLPLLDHKTLALVLRHATLRHFVYSPLLFLPRWRDLVAATRDHSLAPAEAGVDKQPAKSQVTERSKQESTPSLRQSLRDLRRGSITSLTPSPLLSTRAPLPPATSAPAAAAAAASATTDPLNISGRRRHPTGSSGDDRWHQLLCTSLLKEYIQYLQSHGFKTLPKHASLSPHADNEADQQSKSSSSSRFSDDLPSSTFLLLSLRSGAIVLKLFFQEPFFCANLYTLDLCKLRRRPVALTQQHAMSQFMAEVENVRVLLHLHSFAHDFHLRTLGGYLAGRQLIFNRGYHLSAFLANFTHYYKKAANFARNMIYSGSVSIQNTGVSPDQLYNYLLSKEKQYQMAVMRMTPTATDDSHDMLETEYVLVHVHTCHTRQLPHHPKLAEEYEAILLVARDTSKTVGGAAGKEEEFTSSSGTTTAKQDKVMAPLQQELDAQEANAVQDDQTLFLKFYLILTSKRELYPSHVHVQPSRRLSGCHRRTSDRMEDSGPPSGLSPTTPAAAREPGEASTAAAAAAATTREAGGSYRTLSTAPPTPTPRTPRAGSAASRGLNESASHTGSEDEVSASAVSRALEAAPHASAPSAARPPSKLSQITSDTVSSSAGSGSRGVSSRERACIQESEEENETTSASPARILREETVNYLGYFSPYQVTMEQMLLTQARGAVRRIQSVFALAKIHCRRDILWKRLTSSTSEDDRQKGSGSTRSASSSITFSDLEELLELVEVRPVQDTDPRLIAFVRQPLRWQQELVKMIHAKYQHNVRNVTSEDGNEEHVAIMSPNCPHAIIVISTNLREPNSTSFRCVRKELKSDKSDDSVPKSDLRIDGFLAAFINICCFHLWASKL
ncbi:hypothetical protein FHG87_009137 [Trinorchestia longiramus]|nr:hypothetical protein FHG87_009137 [Trinorchestia longiramus]